MTLQKTVLVALVVFGLDVALTRNRVQAAGKDPTAAVRRRAQITVPIVDESYYAASL